jgi:hypothetical protein
VIEKIQSEESASEAIDSWLQDRESHRGIDTYSWVTDLTRRSSEVSSYVISYKDAKCVALVSREDVLLCAIEGEESSSMIESVRDTWPEHTVRALALPGDRVTKNALEHSRMPAQLLVH